MTTTIEQMQPCELCSNGPHKTYHIGGACPYLHSTTTQKEVFWLGGHKLFTLDELRSAVSAAREEERERCALLPRPLARILYGGAYSFPKSWDEELAYQTAWQDYAAAIRALAGEEK